MYKLEIIDRKTFDNFNSKNIAHFMQSSTFGDIKKEHGFIPMLTGLYKDNKLIATALVLKKKIKLGLSYFYIPRGYNLNYKNKEEIEEYTKEIKKMAKREKAVFVTIDPPIELEKLDINGNVVEDLNHDFVDYLQSLGYKHKGYNYFFENREPRYTFNLKLDKPYDEIIKNMHSTIRNIYNRGNPFNVIIDKDKDDELKDFYFLMTETAKRQNIIPFTYKYYEKFYKLFKENNNSDLYMVYVDIKNLKEIYKNKIDKIKSDIEKSEKKNKEGQVKELNNQLKKALKEQNEIKDMKDVVVPLSGYITVKYGDEVWVVHGGNANYLRTIDAAYLAYFRMIKDAYDDGYKSIDFFGTIGKEDKKNPEYGIHLFKKRLGGDYIEFIGEFDLVINRPMHFIYNYLIPIYRKILKKKIGKELKDGA